MSLSLSTPSRFRTRFVVLTPSISLSHSPTLVAHRRFSLSYHFNLVSCILLSKHIHLSLCIGVTLVLYFFLFPITSFFSLQLISTHPLTLSPKPFILVRVCHAYSYMYRYQFFFYSAYEDYFLDLHLSYIPTNTNSSHSCISSQV